MNENRDARTIFIASHFADEFAYACPVMSDEQIGFLLSKPCLLPLKSSLEVVLHSGKPTFISLPVKFPTDRSKFQFCTTARGKQKLLLRELCLGVCFFLFQLPK